MGWDECKREMDREQREHESKVERDISNKLSKGDVEGAAMAAQMEGNMVRAYNIRTGGSMHESSTSSNIDGNNTDKIKIAIKNLENLIPTCLVKTEWKLGYKDLYVVDKKAGAYLNLIAKEIGYDQRHLDSISSDYSHGEEKENCKRIINEIIDIGKSYL